MAKLKFEQQRRINMEKTKAIISTDDKLANAVQVKKENSAVQTAEITEINNISSVRTDEFPL